MVLTTIPSKAKLIVLYKKENCMKHNNNIYKILTECNRGYTFIY